MLKVIDCRIFIFLTFWTEDLSEQQKKALLKSVLGRDLFQALAQQSSMPCIHWLLNPQYHPCPCFHKGRRKLIEFSRAPFVVRGIQCHMLFCNFPQGNCNYFDMVNISIVLAAKFCPLLYIWVLSYLIRVQKHRINMLLAFAVVQYEARWRRELGRHVQANSIFGLLWEGQIAYINCRNWQSLFLIL